MLFDSVRGATKFLFSNDTDAEGTSATSLTSFNADSFSLGAYDGRTNELVDYVAWCWKAGGAAVSNTDGTITSQVSANQDAGFSIVEWSADGSSNGQVGHGLSATPELVITKSLSSSGWWILTTAIDGSLDYLRLDTTAAKVNTSGLTISSTTITNWGYASEDVVAYCFHSVSGYQKVGSYTGTGASGNSVTTGFQPRFLMIKSSSNAEPWFILDAARDTSNPRDNRLMADSSAAEDDGSVHTVNFDSNGFTANGTVANGTNGSGVTYIYLAIA